jgi:hypothetical protein
MSVRKHIQAEKEDTARRIQFDCELPENARSELLRPKHPVILGWPVYQPPECSGTLKWVTGFALCVILLVGMLANYSQSRKVPATPQPDPVLQHSREIFEQSVRPTQPIGPPPPAASAPRARLVLYKRWIGNGMWQVCDSLCTPIRGRFIADPAPKAQLVRLPN